MHPFEDPDVVVQPHRVAFPCEVFGEEAVDVVVSDAQCGAALAVSGADGVCACVWEADGGKAFFNSASRFFTKKS